ncbi:MAG: TrbI/VirB10 family protein [Candidatus Binataceae bacterium]
MDPYKDNPRPPGPGRAWMLATFAMLFGLAGGLYLTAERPKPKYSEGDFRQPPGAGAWADKEAQATPTPAVVAAVPSPVVAPHVTTFNAPVEQYRPAALPCTACEEGERLLAAAQGSAMTVPIAGANTLDLNQTPTTIATRPAPPHAVLANSWIYAVLETGIESDQPGDVIARVSQDVRDTVTQTEVLIPQGSKLHGAVSQSPGLNLNNTSVTVNWDSLQLPNGAEIALPRLPSADTEGYPGLSDKVDRHLAQTWLPSILISAITAGSMLATTSTYGSAQGYSATSQALGQFGSSLGGQSIGNLGMMFQQLRPSIEIRKGTIFRVLVTRDLRFDQPYDEARR